MKNDQEYITQEKKKALEEELKELNGPKRKVILESLEFAKSLGDLSENAEYHQAREDQGKLEDRIAKIEHVLRNSLIISPKKHTTSVEVGSVIIIQKQGDKDTKEYQIVGSEEGDMSTGKISNRSPLGEAIFGKKKGDDFTFKTPKGEVNYKIIDIK